MAHFGKDLDNFSAARTVQIVGSETNEHFTTYIIEVTVGSYTWTVKHRYSEFRDLHEKLVVGYKLDKTLLPPKKLFGNQTEVFVKKRQQDLQVYLQTVLHYMAHHPPPALTFFLDFHLYEIHGITQALAEDLYNRGEMILQSKEIYQVTPLQLYSLTERLKLPEPTCDSGDVKKDLGHILDFITRTKHLQICGSSKAVGTSNINMNQLKFDLSLFKSLQSLEVITCNFQMIQGLETIKQTLNFFNVYRTATTIKEVVLQDVPQWKAEDGTQLVGGWDHVTHVDFSHNFLREIDDSVQILWRVEHFNLSHNHLEGVQHLQWLSQMTHLDLSHNRLRVLDSLHTKLGNLKCLLLTGNFIESLQGFSKLFSLEMLDVSDNKISKVEDVRPLCHLPCLEKLHLTGNPVTLTVDYRTKILEMFGDRVDEVFLDSEKASQKEKDTVAVRLALQKAREAKSKQAGPRKNSSSASLSDVYGGRGETPPLSQPICESLPSESAVYSSSVLDRQHGESSSRISSSMPHQSLRHNWSFSDFKSTHNRSSANIFVPGRSSPSWNSLSSCTSAQEMVEEAELPSPIPEANPFHPSSEARLTVSTIKKEYSATDLPTMTCADFVSWLEDRLLCEDTSTQPSPAQSLEEPGSSTAALCDQVVDVMWCYAQQYTAPGAIFPACVVLTATKVILERLSGTAEDTSFPNFPQLRPCVILPLGSVQHIVIGPCHSYLRLEEAFVGKGGLFTLFAIDTAILKHFADALKDCCMKLDETNPLDILDLSHQSDLLTELCRREASLGLPSDRLAFALLVKMIEHGELRSCFLVLSENIVYILDPFCVYWPPATFESSHEGTIHIKVLKEFSIMDDIVDLALHMDTTDAAKEIKGEGKVGYTLTSLTMQVRLSGCQHELALFFSSCSLRDTFLDRLTNLRAEHAHRMSPNVREAPEGGNESLDTADGSFPPCENGCTAVVSYETMTSHKNPRPGLPRLAIMHPTASLPSSFDWKEYYFTGSVTKAVDSVGKGLESKSVEGVETQVQVEAEVHNGDSLSDIQSSGEVEETPPTPFEQELRQAVRTYELLRPLPSRLRPISLMSGGEVLAFFHNKIAGAQSARSSSSELNVMVSSPSAVPEELRHVMWTTVVPYTNPVKEVVTLVMLSTYAVYLVSDSKAITSSSSVRPSWMTHNRHKSDSAVSWHSQLPSRESGRSGQWSRVKPYAVLVLSDLVQVSMGLFDQFLRLTGSVAHNVFTLCTRNSRQTAIFVEKLKAALSLIASSPSPLADNNITDIEQDFYHAFAKRTNSTVEGLVYIHPSKVTFLYPGDEAIDDILFLIKAKIQATSEKISNLLARLEEKKNIMWLYILAYQLLPPFTESIMAVPPERIQQRSIIVTSYHLCLVHEDIVTYPLPDFVRGLPEQPQHEVVEIRRLENLKRISLSPTNSHVLCLVFWDEPEELIVDTDMQHFGHSGSAARGGGREIMPEVVLKLYIQSLQDKDKLVQTLRKQWRELVPEVGRILDVVRE